MLYKDLIYQISLNLEHFTLLAFDEMPDSSQGSIGQIGISSFVQTDDYYRDNRDPIPYLKLRSTFRSTARIPNPIHYLSSGFCPRVFRTIKQGQFNY